MVSLAVNVVKDVGTRFFANIDGLSTTQDEIDRHGYCMREIFRVRLTGADLETQIIPTSRFSMSLEALNDKC